MSTPRWTVVLAAMVRCGCRRTLVLMCFCGVTGCQKGTSLAKPNAGGKTIQHWADQAVEPLERIPEWKRGFRIDSHGTREFSDASRAEAFRQIETFGAPAIEVLLKLHENSDSDIRDRAIGALKSIGKRIDPETEQAIALLVEALEHASHPESIAWTDQSLLNVGKGMPGVKAMITPLNDRKLRAGLVLEIGDWPDWRQRLLTNIRQDNQSTSSSADYIELEKLAGQIVSYRVSIKNNVGTRDLPPVSELVAQVKSGQNLLGSLSGLYRIAEANATVGGLDLGAATPNLTEAVPVLVDVAGGNQTGIVVLAIKTLGLIGEDARNAVPLLLQQLQSNNYDIRAESATAIGGIGVTDRNVVEALIASLDSEITNSADRNRRPAGLPRGTRGANAGWRSQLPPGTLRRNVAVSLGRLAAHPDISIPALLKLKDLPVLPGLTDQDPIATALGAFGNDAFAAIDPLIKSLGSMSFTQSGLQALREIDPGLQKTVEQLSNRLTDADERKQLRAAQVLSSFARNRNPATAPAERASFENFAIPALTTVAARNESPMSAWATYALWNYSHSKCDPTPVLPILIEALEAPQLLHVTKMTALTDLAAMGVTAKPAVPAIIKAIERGDFGKSGAEYLLKIDPVAAMQAGLVTGLSPENLPSTNLQSLGALERSIEFRESSYKREYDANGNLVLLGLKSARLTDDALADIASYTQLRVLDLSYNDKLTDQGLDSLSTLNNLRSINLNGCQLISDVTLVNLAELPGLEKLDLKTTSVTAEGLRRFSKTHPTAVDPESLDAIELCDLKRIQLNGLRGKLGSEFRLRDLAFGGKQITEESFARVLEGQDSLTSLTVYRTVPFTDSWFKNLSKCPSLEKLHLKYCEGLSTEAFSAIGKLTRLKLLELEGTKIGDAEVKHLRGLIQLEELNLISCNAVTDEGIAALMEMNQMRKLHLRGCGQVTTRSLDVLVSMPHLEFVNLSGIAKSVAETKEYQKALPNCRIQF